MLYSKEPGFLVAGYASQTFPEISRQPNDSATGKRKHKIWTVHTANVSNVHKFAITINRKIHFGDECFLGSPISLVGFNLL